ncbi:MAG: PilN domain-containing protein [Clostridiaceae bacterium]|jgi:Tfp pilus assembly protein PilN|nr:PilN domain-containing protein [Clostridiaceae bacterium]
MKDINFLFSETITDKMENTEKEKTRVKPGVVVVVVLVILIATGILLAPGFYLSGLERQIEKVEASLADPKYSEVRNVKARLDSVSTELNKKKAIINDIDSKSAPSSQVLLMVEHAVPSGCYFTGLNYSGTSLNISGKAESSIIVAEFMSNLDRLNTLSRMTESVSIKQAQSPFTYNLSYGVSGKGGK